MYIHTYIHTYYVHTCIYIYKVRMGNFKLFQLNLKLFNLTHLQFFTLLSSFKLWGLQPFNSQELMGQLIYNDSLSIEKK